MWHNLFVSINQWYINAPMFMVVLALLGVWFAMTIFTIVSVFTINAAELWCKSRIDNFQITAHNLSRYEAHELRFWGMFTLWPIVFIVVVPWATISLFGKFWDVFFVRPTSTFRIVPQWC